MKKAQPLGPRRSRGLTRIDRELWAYATRDVRPLAQPALLADEPPENMEAPVQSPPPAGRPPPQKTVPKPLPSAPPPLAALEPRLRRRLSRGQREVDGRLDLHGMRQDGAHRALQNFLRQSHRAGARVVLVITGKGSAGDEPGLGSGSGILRRMVPHWLRDAGLRAIVLGFEEAALRQGGGGALYVRLRRSGSPES